MKFISLKNWLSENKTQSKKLDYGCIMLYANISNWKEKHLSLIEKEDIYDDEFKDYGLEHEPHATILFGIHLDENKPEEIKEFMKLIFKNPIEVVINKISNFECDDYDVVKYDVPITEELQLYHDITMQTFSNTQTFDEYKPHMTISYVKKGKGKKYSKKIKPFKVKFDTVVYSYKKNKKDEKNTHIKINLK